MKHNKIDLNDGYYLADGGLETTLIYHYGIELPHFAAFELATNPAGRKELTRYYTPYLQMAQKYELGFILESPTWRANPDWGFKLGYSEEELDGINRDAIDFLRELKATHEPALASILLSGCIGPRSDGYIADKKMSSMGAKAYHSRQIETFAGKKADLITAMTLNYTDEAVGIALAAKDAGIPAVISFTVETDGSLPGGETLREAIETTDLLTDGYPSHYMINCAHPEHFKRILESDGSWKTRIRGIRANASTRSHAELDASNDLDPGDKELLANGYSDLKKVLPELKVIGGCCGSDHSHMEEICKKLVK